MANNKIRENKLYVCSATVCAQCVNILLLLVGKVMNSSMLNFCCVISLQCSLSHLEQQPYKARGRQYPEGVAESLSHSSNNFSCMNIYPE